jgi:hypothetical protein
LDGVVFGVADWVGADILFGEEWEYEGAEFGDLVRDETTWEENIVMRRVGWLDFRMTRYLGCITAFLVFIWRYLNVPENWSYVASWWSIGGMIVTLLPETVYPFFYVWAHRKERENAMAEIKLKDQKSWI